MRFFWISLIVSSSIILMLTLIQPSWANLPQQIYSTSTYYSTFTFNTLTTTSQLLTTYGGGGGGGGVQTSNTVSLPILGPFSNPNFGIWPQVVLSGLAGFFVCAMLRNGLKLGFYAAGLLILLWATYQTPIPNITTLVLPLVSDLFGSLLKLIQSVGYLTTIAFGIGFIVSWQQPGLREGVAKKLI